MHRNSRPGFCLFLLICSVLPGIATSEESILPQPVDAEHFTALKEHSPFLRMLSLKETYALRGVATIDGEALITLQNRKTKKTITVSGEKENDLGMRLATVSGSKPDDTAVKILYGGSEFEFTYEEAVIRPKTGTSQGSRDTVRRDREGRIITSEELVKKWQSLSEGQRRAYDKWKEQLLRARPDLRHSEKRFPIAHKALDAFKTGRTPPPIR